ncbi:MAG: RNA methyltransferase [Oscillospiraceae bacterium]|nr:RNA methyltransferase [Oscillospiraceae bacterium]
MEFITGNSNERIKNIVNLVKDKKTRQKQGLFVIEGLKIILEAKKTNIKIKTILLTEKFFKKNKSRLKNILDNTLEIIIITENISKKISSNVTPQEVFAVCQIPETKLLDHVLDKKNINNINNILMILNLQDIGNFGTIIRTANALGIDCILISSDCPDIYSPKVLRATMGAIFNINIIKINNNTDDIKKIIKSFKDKNFMAVASAVADDCKNINQISFLNKNLIIVGNEGNGLDREIIKICDESVKIPMIKEADSLNVAVASGILIWELVSKTNKLYLK